MTVEDQCLLDTEGAARRLGLSSSTLEKLRVYGGGPAYLKLGRLVRYRGKDLTNWVNDRIRYNTSTHDPFAGVSE